MLNGTFAMDLLHADKARRAAKMDPILTATGRRVLADVVRIAKPLPQAEIDAIIRGSLKDKPKSQT
jgi:hypothetical protein